MFSCATGAVRLFTFQEGSFTLALRDTHAPAGERSHKNLLLEGNRHLRSAVAARSCAADSRRLASERSAVVALLLEWLCLEDAKEGAPCGRWEGKA